MSVLHTRICDLLGVRYPIVQTGMGWVSGARLTAATSSAGGFGILAAATMTLPELTAAVDKVQERTDAPFGVNLRADQPDVDDVIALIIDRKITLASFAGAPRRALIDQLKTAGILTMPTIGAPRHAVKMQSWGVDAVIAQGGEGGGHTGTIATSQLLPAVTASVDIPVLGAGGFSDGRGLVAALAYGADGIAMGTRFLLTAESQVPDGRGLDRSVSPRGARDAQDPEAELAAARDGGERTDDDSGDHGGGSARSRHPAHRTGHRTHRQPAHRRGPAR